VKTYQIIEEETIRAVYEIEVPDDIAAKGEDAIYDYWYNIEEPGMHLIESECIDCRSEEHTSEFQSHHDLVCRLLLVRKKNQSD